ncbi:DUF2268 domain-containing protein [Domibacillus epiphyticus]|uniref:DUF2268 domain-containing protein n=1 Tax=Domibacillus epiphyticus TaxID=1714355 RepID=A0A1V2A6B0_9BACI|nr:DUF2268 domain-containing putative Zn-dependent protease [Domibacillus epiphyticus]OMP66354.1 hypothetical protein BTO28_12905 [Domibacillus epiphyticus]
MSVQNTVEWLYHFVKVCKERPLKDPYFIQCDVLCCPLKGLFPNTSVEEIHYHLLTHGLFEPSDWLHMEKVVQRMEENNIWELVSQEFKRLKNIWNGPETSIFIFPIKDSYLATNYNMIKKNGVAFKRAIFLFLSPDLEKEEVKAVLAHEYNHVCRLAYLNLDVKDISLKDALIIEGLGEFAVKDLYGEKWLSRWTKLYSYEKTLKIWSNHFISSLNIKGNEKYDVFLYGKGNNQLPNWIGYQIGFQIIESYHSVYGPFKNNELYIIPSQELIEGSKFPLN